MTRLLGQCRPDNRPMADLGVESCGTRNDARPDRGWGLIPPGPAVLITGVTPKRPGLTHPTSTSSSPARPDPGPADAARRPDIENDVDQIGRPPSRDTGDATSHDAPLRVMVGERSVASRGLVPDRQV